jgi:hypothetical protein
VAEKEVMVVYAAAYGSVDVAMADLQGIEQLHKDEMIGRFDAAVIDKEDHRPRVVKTDGSPAHAGDPGMVRPRGLAPQGALRRG